MQQLFYCILYCFTLLFSKPLVNMMFHQCSIQNKDNTREALLKKNHKHRFIVQHSNVHTTDPTYMFFLPIPLLTT